MDSLPNDVFLDICAKSSRLRADLLIIPDAEAAGWSVAFRDNNWHNAADFHKDSVHVWLTSSGWRRATLEDDRFTKPTVFSNLREALGL